MTFTWNIFYGKYLDTEGIYRHGTDLEFEKFVLSINEYVRCGCPNGWMNCCPKHTCWVNNLTDIEQNLPEAKSDKLKNDEAVAEINTAIRKSGLHKWQWCEFQNSGTENACWHW